MVGQDMNDFFVRELHEPARPIASPSDQSVVTSAADCRLMCFPTWEVATRVWIKGQEFTVPKFLGDDALAAEMEGGSMVIFRLAPQDYHRFHFPLDGKLVSSADISGHYFTVNPIAVNHEKVRAEQSRAE